MFQLQSIKQLPARKFSHIRRDMEDMGLTIQLVVALDTPIDGELLGITNSTSILAML